MMPDMSNDRQPNETAGRWWVLPALAAIMVVTRRVDWYRVGAAMPAMGR